ncbi:superoxide dismutase [Mn], mitochondrial isoform X1 [Coccinella septempunctata]|uniref:superoxide dismutase [Mn], mitochondrial isoform X1 n=1 Tax=Coccinella septempunctata TaxID=41139 RepID=UPI001D07AD6E|nr:superoxide dismutase [Mn], mitochondrial isoform X1 [Coccinella septempunctata]
MFSLTRTITASVRNARSKFTLPEMPYNYKALEPIISGEIMEIHHTKHHQAYITNYNAAEEKLKAAVEKGDASAIIALQGALRFNGGGHINHSIFWNNLTPDSTKPSAELNSAIEASFGSFEKMVQQLSTVSVGVQGSGWGWLGYDKNEGKIKAVACANQDPLEATTGLIPLLGIDVWEHAYYLQYRNVRADYVKSIFDVVNWTDVSERLSKAKK